MSCSVVIDVTSKLTTALQKCQLVSYAQALPVEINQLPDIVRALLVGVAIYQEVSQVHAGAPGDWH